MKIYISVDMEGASGISASEYVLKDGYLYAAGRRLITQDINAAVRGAFDGGAEEVIVFDGHGGRVNVLVEDLDPRALVIAGAAHKPRFPMLDKSVDGMFLLGNVEAAMVKQGLARNCALCLSPARGQQLVYESAKRAVERLKAGESFGLPEIPSPATVAITYKMVPDADAAETYDSKRVDGYTVEKTYGHLSEMYGGNWADYGIEQVIF